MERTSWMVTLADPVAAVAFAAAATVAVPGVSGGLESGFALADGATWDSRFGAAGLASVFAADGFVERADEVG